jgi:hypothetical protein
LFLAVLILSTCKIISFPANIPDKYEVFLCYMFSIVWLIEIIIRRTSQTRAACTACQSLLCCRAREAESPDFPFFRTVGSAEAILIFHGCADNSGVRKEELSLSMLGRCVGGGEEKFHSLLTSEVDGCDW